MLEWGLGSNLLRKNSCGYKKQFAKERRIFSVRKNHLENLLLKKNIEAKIVNFFIYKIQILFLQN